MSEDWWSQAACRGKPTEWFFPDPGESHELACQVCAECRVRDDCLDHALRANVEHGMWGGLDERSRRRLRRQRRTKMSA